MTTFIKHVLDSEQLKLRDVPSDLGMLEGGRSSLQDAGSTPDIFLQ